MLGWGGFQVTGIQNGASGVWMSVELWVRFRRRNLLVMVAMKAGKERRRWGPRTDD